MVYLAELMHPGLLRDKAARNDGNAQMNSDETLIKSSSSFLIPRQMIHCLCY